MQVCQPAEIQVPGSWVGNQESTVTQAVTGQVLKGSSPEADGVGSFPGVVSAVLGCFFFLCDYLEVEALEN